MPILWKLVMFVLAFYASFFVGNFVYIGFSRFGHPILGWFIAWAIILGGVCYFYLKIFRKKIFRKIFRKKVSK